MPVQQTLTASRNATWAPPLAYYYSGGALPLTGARIAMQLRVYGGAVGDAVLTLNPIAFTDAAVLNGNGSLQLADDGNPLRVLTLAPSIPPGSADGSTANSLNALPGLNTPETGDPQTFNFDIRISYADGTSEILSAGQFIVSPGVTIV